MNIKMIATDLDGTLLHGNDGFNTSVSDYTLSVLKKCRAKGIKITYATARDAGAPVPALAEMVDGYVQNNGAKAYIGDTLVYKRAIPIESVRDLLIAADNAGVKITAEQDGTFYGNFSNREGWVWQWPSSHENIDFNTLDIEANFLVAIANSPEESKTAEQVIKKYLPDDLNLLILEKGVLLVVLHKDAIKSKGVAALAAHWGIEPSEIAAFGDATIDIDLLEYCGAGVAVSNAIDEVKNVADYICESNDNDGVAKWIEKYILID